VVPPLLDALNSLIDDLVKLTCAFKNAFARPVAVNKSWEYFMLEIKILNRIIFDLAHFFIPKQLLFNDHLMKSKYFDKRIINEFQTNLVMS